MAKQTNEDILRQIQKEGGSKAQQQVAEALAQIEAEQAAAAEEVKRVKEEQRKSILTKKDVREIFDDMYSKKETQRNKELRKILVDSFKEMYDAAEKKRVATSPQGDGQLSDDLANDYKRDAEDTRYGVNSVAQVTRDNNNLLQQQIQLQTRGITLLSSIEQIVRSQGGLFGGRGPSIVPGPVAKTPTANVVRNAAVIGGAGVAAASVASQGARPTSSSSAPPPSGPTPTSPPPSSAPSSSRTPVTATTASSKEKKSLEFNSDRLSFKSKSIVFEVDKLTIDAKDVKRSEMQQLKARTDQQTKAAGGSTSSVTPASANATSTSTGAAATGGASGSVSSTPGSTTNTGAGTSAITPGMGAAKAAGSSENAKKALAFFKSKGWTDEQAAAIVGNLQQESGGNLDPGAVGDGGKAMGIAQWHADRRALFKQATGKDFSQSAFEDQLAFVDWELHNTERAAGAALKNTKSLQEAAMVVDRQYERSKGTELNQRIANAGALVGAAASTSSSTTASQTTAPTQAASVTGANPKEKDRLDQRDREDMQWGQEHTAAVNASAIQDPMRRMVEKQQAAMHEESGKPKPPAAAVAARVTNTKAAKPPAPKSTTKTIEIDDPNWDRHAKSRAMFQKAQDMAARGENDTAAFFAADKQRQLELSMSPPKIKKTITVAAPKPKPVKAMPTRVPDILAPTVGNSLWAGKDPAAEQAQEGAAAATAFRAQVEKNAERDQALRTADMLDQDTRDTYGPKVAAERQQLETTRTNDIRQQAGETISHIGPPVPKPDGTTTGRALTPRNAALAIQGPEASAEAAQAASDARSYQVDAYAPKTTEQEKDKTGGGDPKTKAPTPSNGGDDWLSHYFPYLFGKKDPALAVGSK